MTQHLQMYYELAARWNELSPPTEYVEEATEYRRIMETESATPPQTLLELGCGGGSNAYHLKQHYQLTLVDLSPEMLAVSQANNPDCEHHQGDMRTVRLERLFDIVFIHDAIDYMLTVDDLRQAFETAYLHCKPNGIAVFVPDCVSETFAAYTSNGGYGNFRYLQWIWKPQDADTYAYADYAFMWHEADGTLKSAYERHTCAVFPLETWLDTLRSVGFEAKAIEAVIELESEGEGLYIFVGKKNA